MIIYDRLFVNSGILNHKNQYWFFPENLMDVSTVVVLFNAVQAQQDIAHPFGCAAAFRDNNCSGLLIDRAEKQFGWWGTLGKTLRVWKLTQPEQWAKTAQLMSLTGLVSSCFLLAVNVLDYCYRGETSFVPEVLDKHPQLCLLITRLDCSLTRIRLSDIVSNRHWIALSLEAAIRRSPLYRLDGEGGLQRYANENAKICQAWNWLTNADQCQQISVLVPVVDSIDLPHFTDHHPRRQVEVQCSAFQNVLKPAQHEATRCIDYSPPWNLFKPLNFKPQIDPQKVKIILTTIETAW